MGLNANVAGFGEERIRAACNRIDLNRPGALEAFNALRARGLQATPKEYEALAKQFPLEFRGVSPVSPDTYAKALARLRKGGDRLAMAVHAGADIHYENPPRLSTGCLTIDYVLNGGIPRGYIGQFKGGDSMGKTFTAMQTVAEAMRRGGRGLWIAAERFDKPWARICGIPIPYGEQEMSLFDDQQRTWAKVYNELHPEGENFAIATGRNGDDLLQFVCDCITYNVWDVIVIDSVATLRREARLDKNVVGDDSMGGEAKMLNEFCARVEASFNFVEGRHGKVIGETHVCKKCGAQVKTKAEHETCPDGTKPKWETLKEIGDPVRTAIIAINQLRDRGIGSMFPQKPDAGGGHGLKHHKGYDLDFQSAEPLSAEHGGRIIPYGKRVIVEATKSKIGPPYRTGVYEMAFATIPGICEAGRFNFMVDLLGAKWKQDKKIMGLGEICGVIKYDPPYYYVGDQRFHGFPTFKAFLEHPDNTAVVQALRLSIQDWIMSGGI